MDTNKHIEILRMGFKVWNIWRDEQAEIKPDLMHADLMDADLRYADLAYADLRFAHLSGANLAGAYLYGADLRYIDLVRANLINANLSKADLRGAFLRGADLRGANLASALLGGGDFPGADLAGANLTSAFLVDALFHATPLARTNLTGAAVGYTSFTKVDLSRAIGLESVVHMFPSSVSVDTVYESKGRIPEAFLRGCGMPELFIRQIPALVAAPELMRFHSCFISYSSKDQVFAERLHADLQAKGVRVWFAPHDLSIGARIRPAIDESIRVYDKLLLVLSKTSISSQWVEQEVETALRKERQGGSGAVLFPVRIDNSVLEVSEGWPALITSTRNVGDFLKWKNRDSYQKAFDRLLRDLEAEEAKPKPGRSRKVKTETGKKKGRKK